jgi:Na+-translocating ferredoxin:NAD+ oxidoreductase RnfG subunit
MDQAIELAKTSDSTIIILLVVIAIIVVALIPVMKTVANIRANEKKQDYDREGLLIQVIQKNTEVNSALKTLIESDQKHCDTCKSEQFALFKKMFDNQEIANMKLTEISQKLERE